MTARDLLVWDTDPDRTGRVEPCPVCWEPDSMFGARRGTGLPSREARRYGCRVCVRCMGRGVLRVVTVREVAP